MTREPAPLTPVRAPRLHLERASVPKRWTMPIRRPCRAKHSPPLSSSGPDPIELDEPMASEKHEVAPPGLSTSSAPLRIGGVSICTPSGVRADFINHRFLYRALFEELIEAAKREGPLMRVG